MQMAARLPRRRVTIGMDKYHDQRRLITGLREMVITPHGTVAKTRNRRSGIDARTTQHPAYGVRQRKRKLVRRGVWLGENDRAAAQVATSGRPEGRLDLHLPRSHTTGCGCARGRWVARSEGQRPTGQRPAEPMMSRRGRENVFSRAINSTPG